MKILNTTFETIMQENGKKKVNVDGPLALGIVMAPFAALSVFSFALGRLTKRR